MYDICVYVCMHAFTLHPLLPFWEWQWVANNNNNLCSSEHTETHYYFPILRGSPLICVNAS